ncbi:MAG: transposase [Candidatus Competibacteraceae bacterium]|nr:transposase [Candidatus Competibacteraceae bacterium]
MRSTMLDLDHCLARAVNDAGFGALRQMIEYKAELRGCVLRAVNGMTCRSPSAGWNVSAATQWIAT